MESLAWSNADIEYPSTATADETVSSTKTTDQSEPIGIDAQFKDFTISDKTIAESQQQLETESLSKFVLDDDASICTYPIT